MSKKKKAPARRPQQRKRVALIAPAAGRGQPANVQPGFPIVGIGASAGGLEAFSELLHALPANPGLAIILISHLAPQHESALPTLLSTRTKLPVVQALEGMRVERDHVYVIPPNVQMGMIDETLHLNPRPTDRSQYTPIDFFLRCLAEAAQDRAIAVILSGTASDGTGGVREVKAAGGIVFAQTPDSARHDGMPRAAIATGVVDLILAPEAIAAELVRIAEHPLRRQIRPPSDESTEAASTEEPLRRVLGILRRATGVDFTRYKRPTIQRRLQRRMVLHKISRLDRYVEYLQKNPSEVQALYRDILIHVTRFFRDPDSFDTLKSNIFPRVIESRRDEEAVRIWVPGCSTGEEAYSTAIVLLEYLGEHDGVPIQVFATDVSDTAIEHARAGVYPEGMAADVSPQRLGRFFSKVAGGYRINKVVRDACIFARQDLTRDPPFSKLALIMCRNVLIYMDNELQKKVMHVFHYALKPNGFLMLGSAETVGLHSDLFGPVDKKHRVYQKKAVPSPVLSFPVEHPAVLPTSMHRRAPVGAGQNRMIVNEADRIVQDRFTPTGVIVDPDLQVIQFRGQTGRYLEPAPGEPSLNLLKMTREGLLHDTRTAIHEVQRTGASVRREHLRVRMNGDWHEVNLQAVPLGGGDRPYCLVLFEDAPSPLPRVEKGKRKALAVATQPNRGAGDERAIRLEQELAASREYLQSIIQELEASNEELQSANEEILSSNEELQSTNEELDTAKEELQSTNEELNTVNEELHGRNDELTSVNSDLVNLLGSAQVAIVVVTAELRIRRFTPMAEQLLNLIPSDIGRSITHIKPNIECPDLEDSIVRVIETVTPIEREIRDRQGKWLLLRIRPYKNAEHRIDGALIALIDIQTTKGSEELVRRGRAWADVVLGLVREPVVIVDAGLRVQAANAAFTEAFGIPLHETQNRPFFELGNGEWSAPPIRELLEQVLRNQGDGKVKPLKHELGAGRPVVVNARRIGADGGPFVLLTLEEPRRPPRGGCRQA